MKRKIYTFKDHLKESFQDPEFRKVWEESEAEYQLVRSLIKKRLERKMTQVQLAQKAKTTQAVISRIEGMNANPSLATLKRLANALDSKLEIAFK